MDNDTRRAVLETWLSLNCGKRWSDVEDKARPTGYRDAIDLVLKNLKRSTLGGPVVTTPRSNCWSGGVPLQVVSKVWQRDVYFVDPDTQRLSLYARPRTDVIKDTATRTVIDANKQRVRVNGRWYLVTLAIIPADRRFIDCFGLRTVTACRKKYGSSLYGVSKVECSSNSTKVASRKTIPYDRQRPRL